MVKLEVCGALELHKYPGKAGFFSVPDDSLGALSVPQTRDVGTQVAVFPLLSDRIEFERGWINYGFPKGVKFRCKNPLVC